MEYKNDIQSDDDFDYSNNHMDNCQSSTNGDNLNQENHMDNGITNGGLSKAELRKTNKPIMEKRRRARINHCLNELKSLILEAMKKDPARHTKLEKADILEMTVKHLQSVQRQQLNMAIQSDPTVIHKFKTGFIECAEEVNRYINQMEGVDPSVKVRLNNHLNNCASNLDQISSMAQFSNGYTCGNIQNSLFGSTLTLAATAHQTVATNLSTTGILLPNLSQDLNNNQGTAIQMSGVRLIPSRLPSGEFALIMPNSESNQNFTNLSLLSSSRNPSIHETMPTIPNTSNGTTRPSLSPPFNDFTHNFKRLSAFSKPQTAHNNIANNKISNSYNGPYQQTCLTSANYQYSVQSSMYHSTTTASPPLSPISAISSQNDDSSITHNSSDYVNSQDSNNDESKTKKTSFTGVFNSLPSTSTADSSFNLSNTGHIYLQEQQQPQQQQQQQILPTNENELLLKMENINSSTRINSPETDAQRTTTLQLDYANANSNANNNISLKRTHCDAMDSGIYSEEEATPPPAKKKHSKDFSDDYQDKDEQDNMWRPW